MNEGSDLLVCFRMNFGYGRYGMIYGMTYQIRKLRVMNFQIAIKGLPLSTK